MHIPHNNNHHYPASGLAGVEPSSPSGQRSCAQLTLILISLFLLLTAMILSVYAGLNPSWQVVEIREFLAEHHHGLWLDCTRAERPAHLQGRIGTGPTMVDKSPLHCTYKIDSAATRLVDEKIHSLEPNAAAAEAEHHQFYGWHKAVLLFILTSLMTGGGAFIMGMCSPCSPSCALVHSVLCFFSFLSAIVASAIFFFAAHRVDARFVQGLVGTYEQSIGEAFYCYLAACILLMLVFILSIISAYNSLRTNAEFQQQVIGGATLGGRRDVLTPLYPDSQHSHNGMHGMAMGQGEMTGFHNNGMSFGRYGGYERKTQV